MEPTVWGTRYPTRDILCELYGLGCVLQPQVPRGSGEVHWWVHSFEGVWSYLHSSGIW